MADLTARQKEIIEVAVKLMAEGGIQKLTMKNIARAMKISEPAIYRHFESKMDILLSMLTQFKQHSGDHLRSARALNGLRLAQLETIFLEHAGAFLQIIRISPRWCFRKRPFKMIHAWLSRVFSIMTTADETIAEVIDEAQHNGEIRADLPKEHLTLMILGTLRLMVKRWRLTGYAFDLQQESRQVWNSLKTLLAIDSSSP